MPALTRTSFENAALEIGYSRGRAKSMAARIMARPDIAYIAEQLTLPDCRTYSDPVGEEAVWNVMTRALMAAVQQEVAA